MKRTVALLLAALLLAALLPVRSLAEEDAYKTINVRNGVWYPVQYRDTRYSDNDNDYIWVNAIYTNYKLKLSKDSLVTIDGKGFENAYIKYMFYCDNYRDDYGTPIRMDVGMVPVKGVKTYALNKGTYYLSMVSGDKDNNPPLEFRFKWEAVDYKPNYCRAKAILLERGKTEKFAQNYKHCYNRWYKINLNQKRKINVYTNFDVLMHTDLGWNIDIFDARMHPVKCLYYEDHVTSEKAMPKGTYYIRMKYPSLFSSNIDLFAGKVIWGMYCTLRWK